MSKMINKEKKPPIDWLIEQCIKHQGILNMNQLLQAKEIEVDLKKEEFQKHFESKRNYGFFKIKKLKNIPEKIIVERGEIKEIPEGLDMENFTRYEIKFNCKCGKQYIAESAQYGKHEINARSILLSQDKFVCYHCGKDYFGMLLNNKKEQIIVIPLDSIIEYSKMPKFFGKGFKNNVATMMFYKLFNYDDVMTLDMFKKIIIKEHNPLFKN
jgi:hypothetical protein